MKKKIIIFGSNGQLGSTIKKKIKKKNFDIIAFNSLKGDISNFKKIKKIFSKYSPDIVINCAAMTNVDTCETDKKLAYLINTLAVKNLSEQCLINKSLLVHFSTDYIFNSNTKVSFKENDIKKPINYYGESKLKGEEEIIKSGCNYLIFRISWLFSRNKKNFLNFFIEAIKNNKKIFIVQNYGSPTSTRLVVNLINLFFLKKELYGYKKIFNLSCDGYATWKDIFFHISKKIKKEKEITKFELVDKITSWKAKRPKCSKLSCKKIEKFLSIKTPNWKKELNYYLN